MRWVFAEGAFRVRGSIRGLGQRVGITAVKTRGTVDVRDFGASEDRDDNTVQIQNAINYASAGRLRRGWLRIKGLGPQK